MHQLLREKRDAPTRLELPASTLTKGHPSTRCRQEACATEHHTFCTFCSGSGSHCTEATVAAAALQHCSRTSHQLVSTSNSHRRAKAARSQRMAAKRCSQQRTSASVRQPKRQPATPALRVARTLEQPAGQLRVTARSALSTKVLGLTSLSSSPRSTCPASGLPADQLRART